MINNNSKISEQDLKRVEVLAELFPNESSVIGEIINLKSIASLPKGTEHFISDLHGEYDTFYHILNNCSGVIKEKANVIFVDRLTAKEIADFCTLIYYPEQKLKLMEKENELTDEKYRELLGLCTELAITVASKHTRLKVRSCLPEGYSFIIDEMMHAAKDETGDQKKYHEQLYKSIIEIGAAKDVIVAYAKMIKKIAVDHLHILGDLFDRGPRADKIIETLLNETSLDIEWGNHDILWMGAASGNEACIATVVYLSLRYNTYFGLENGYGISLRDLFTYAVKAYPTGDPLLSAKRCMAVILAKVEGALLLCHPEYGMSERLFLNQIDYSDYTLEYEGERYTVEKESLLTVDPASPYTLTAEESEIITNLKRDFKESAVLQKHISFLYAKGNAYKIYNGNLLYHGCIPLNKDGTLAEVEWQGKAYKGKSLLDFAEACARRAYFKRSAWETDFMWYLWCGILSPFSGRKMKLFEHIYLPEKTGKEPKNAYYEHLDNESSARLILREFGLDPASSLIINGHTPVHASEGESPVKAGGKILVIDGGFCKAYHKKTGNAGYTLIYNSHGIRLKAHQPFKGLEDAVSNNLDIFSESETVEEFVVRRFVYDTDKGKKMAGRIHDLELLLLCYRRGLIHQK